VTKLTAADVRYIRGNYVTLEELCANRSESPGPVQELIAARRLPRPSYVLADGTQMFPADYFRLLDESGGVDAAREHFFARHQEAARAQRVPIADVDRDWEGYLDGTYGICLRKVTPETIVRKTALVASLCQLLMLPRLRNAEWRQKLRAQVDKLDALERDFAPDCGRSADHDRPPTRDLLIKAAHERYPDLFADAPNATLAGLR
jgi:Family of unknown function (DUF6058)